jgi:phage FluMu protein Com
MIKIKCPKCKEPALSRINHDVVVSEHFEIIGHVDHVIEGGEERRITYKTIETVEDGEHFIEELESNQLEFQCDSCGFFLNGITNEEEMIDFAEDNNLFVEVADEN